MAYEYDRARQEIFDDLRFFGFMGVALTVALGVHAYKANKSISDQTITTTFGVGEHVLAVPTDIPRNGNTQCDYHEGYQVLDIEDKYIVYTNTEPVKCNGYLDNDENVHYIEFGEPVEYKNESSKSLILTPGSSSEE